MGISDELGRLAELKDKGALTEEEFEKAKAEVLAGHRPGFGQQMNRTVDDLSRDENNYAMIIHLSQFCGYVVPGLGWVVPFILWLLKKEESPAINAHGKVVINWLLSQIIYFLGGVLLMIIFIGVFIMIAVAIVGIVFPIIGAVKAKDGELWPYPLSITFLK